MSVRTQGVAMRRVVLGAALGAAMVMVTGGLTTWSAVGQPSSAAQSATVKAAVDAARPTVVVSPPDGDQVPVTIRVLDRSGQPVADGHAHVTCSLTQLGPPPSCDVPVERGVGTVSVLPGVYNFVVSLTANTTPRTAFVLLPEVTVSAPTELVADARSTRSATLTVADPDAKMTDASVSFCYGADSPQKASCRMLFSVRAPNLADLAFNATGPINPPGGFSFNVQALFARTRTTGSGHRDTTGDATSPHAACDFYHAAVSEKGRMPAAPSWRLTARDFAVVHSVFRAQKPGVAADLSEVAHPPGRFWDHASLLREHIATLPAERVECYQTGPTWSRRFSQGDDPGDNHVDSADQVSYVAGKSYHDLWNAAVRGPGLAMRTEWNPDPDQLSVFRENVNNDGRDALSINLSMYSDPQRRQVGYDDAAHTVRTVVYRDGEPVGDPVSGQHSIWLVDREPATYTISAHAHATDPNVTLSDDIQLDWTLRSGPAAGVQALPVTALTFAPRLDANNQASHGASVPIDIGAYRQPGSPAPHVSHWELAVSFDNGDTWRQLPVTGGDDHAHANIEAPPSGEGDGSVALDATAVDQDGSTVHERVAHAFLLR